MWRVGILALFALVAVQEAQGSFFSHHHQVQKKAKQEYTPLRELCPFGYGTGCGGGGGAGLSQATKDQVANILKGIISNLSHKKGLTQISAQLIKDEGLHQAKNVEVKKALLGLLSAFSKDQKATSEVVSKLTGELHGSKNLSALAAVSSALTKMQPLQEPAKHTPRGKWQPLTTDKPSPKAPPAGPIVKK